MALMDIKINDLHIGTVDPEELTIGDQLDLERAGSLDDLLDWLVDHAGANEETLEDTLRPLKLGEIMDLAESISTAIGAAIPKANGGRSRQRSDRKTARGRRRG